MIKRYCDYSSYMVIKIYYFSIEGYIWDMNCLFWNTGRKKINNFIVEIVKEYDIDLLCLAEYKDNPKELLNNVSVRGKELYSIPTIGCKRIDLFSVYTPGKFQHLTETNYYTFKRVPHPELGLLTFGFVHFPSKMHMQEVDFEEEARLFRLDIETVEEEVRSDDTILIGDFNMNPFEKGMMAATFLHAYPTTFEAKKGIRIIKQRKYKTFYNPMWNYWGDKTGPAGTYYYNGSKHQQLYWNMFDQVIFRPSLISKISSENIHIITHINGKDIVNKNGIPSVSDHLPLFFRIG